MTENDKFDYVYSAPTERQRKEIESIKKQYASVDVSLGLKELRALNRKVHTLPLGIAVTLGIAALLLFGFGITLILQFDQIIWGCVVGVAGIGTMVGNYFLYRLLLQRRKKKYDKQIVDLSDRLLAQDK